MILFHALSLLGVLIAACIEVEREQKEARRRLLGRARARALDDGSRCPYCHDEFEPETPAADGPADEDPGEHADPRADPQPRIRCADCGTRHHTTCWEEHGACSVYGCGRVSQNGAGEEALTPSPAAAIPAPAKHETVGEDRSALDPRG